jgi:hypothetical protein
MALADEKLRRELATVAQILEDLPDGFRPESNIEDMHAILAGHATGRDGLIIMQGVTTALALCAHVAIAHQTSPDPGQQGFISIDEVYNGRIRAFAGLFQAAAMFAGSIGALYVEACSRAARVP